MPKFFLNSDGEIDIRGLLDLKSSIQDVGDLEVPDNLLLTKKNVVVIFIQ